MARKPRSVSSPGWGCAVLFALPFAFVGLGFSFSLLVMEVSQLRMQFWQPTPCFITETELHNDRDGDGGTTYKVTAKYRYQFAGRDYSGERVSLLGGSDNIGTHHQRWFAEFAKCRDNRQPFTGYVNPGDPGESILIREVPWLVALFYTLFAMIFTGVGCGMQGAMLAAYLQEKCQRVTVNDHLPGWEQRADWAAGEIRYSDQFLSRLLLGIGGFSLLISLHSAWAAGQAIVFQKETWAWFGMLPCGLALVVLRYGLLRWLRWRRYGNSCFQMAAVPGVVGGKLAGVIRIERQVDSPGGFELQLKCTATESSGEETTTKIEWEQERILRDELYSDEFNGTAIPVLFGIPFACRETCSDPQKTRSAWKLSVRSLTPGNTYQAEFEVPVFRTEKSDLRFELDESALDKYAAPVDPDALLQKAGIWRDTLETGETRFTFPARRNPGFLVAMGLLQVAFAAIAVVLCYFFWRSAWPYVAGLLSLGVVWGIFDLCFYRSEVTLSNDELALRKGCLTLGAVQTIPASGIADLLLTVAGSVGDRAAFDLSVKLHSGQTILLAKRIMPKGSAEDVQQRLRALLAITAPTLSRDETLHDRE